MFGILPSEDGRDERLRVEIYKIIGLGFMFQGTRGKTE